MPEMIKGEDTLKQIMWDDMDGYKVIDEVCHGSSRWHTKWDTIFLREDDGKMFIASWRKAATEMQEHEYPNEAHECEAYEVTSVKYRRI